MDRIEDLLRRIRDPRECVELLLAAPCEDVGSVARQLAAVLSSLPAVHRELGDAPGRLAAVGALVRGVGQLELLMLHAAGHHKGGLTRGNAHRGGGARRPARARRVRDVGRMALR